MKKNKLVIEQSSKCSFDETVDLIVAEAEKWEWKVPAIHDLQQSLAKSGKTVKPVKVIEVCKPFYSGQLLELSNERIMSVMMPCRISVYIKDDDKTYVSVLNGSEISANQTGKIAKVMKESSGEIVEIVKSALK